MSYSTDSKLARSVCERIGADFDINFVAVMRRGDRIYVTGTAGKPDEWAWLGRKANFYGYHFKNHRGELIPPKTEYCDRCRRGVFYHELTHNSGEMLCAACITA